MKNKKFLGTAFVRAMVLSAMVTATCPSTLVFAEQKAELVSREEADEYRIIDSFETARSDEVSCTVSAQTICPEGFGLNTFVLLVDEKGNVYRIALNAANDYTGYIYLASGSYSVTEVSVFEDFKQEYPFVVGEDSFTLAENENKTISFTMKDFDRIQEEINQKTGNQELSTVLGTDEVFYQTGLEGVKMQGTGILYYDVEHIGKGSGVMECSGVSTGDYDLLVKIVKTGVVGEAQYQISLDGGQSFIGQDIVAESCKIGDAGVTLFFHTPVDTEEFLEGEEFHAKLPETHSMIASKAGMANVVVTGHPLKDHDLTVEVLSSGGNGSARFTVTSTKGSTIQVTDVIPKDGIYQLEDDVKLIFSKSESYEKGMTFTATIKSNDETVNYFPLYVLLGGVAVIGAVGVAMLAGKKESNSQYQIRRYEGIRDEKDYE